ncbi:hypothetical protein K2173_014018 [Erythroxylum novogranatense]|uniref:Uncharacterized protein n=1 Tax=Erythroxylum novogranatense TaxID=1862640 RepID=A0AAV8SD43_9ROSI|nr:hypothetical protein K2173_014018 [Erythroxylum novogranatense]
MSSERPTLPQCLPLEQITLTRQKCTRSGEVRRVLGFPLGSAAEDLHFGVVHAKSSTPIATEELKHFKESVQDTSRKARYRSKMLHDSLFKLEKYRESLSSKKQRRNDLSLVEKPNGLNVPKAGGQIYRSSHGFMTQRLDDKAKSVNLHKRTLAEDRPAVASRQQLLLEKSGDTLQDNGGPAGCLEGKIRRFPGGGEGWETKNKKKRSVGIMGTRATNGEQDLKRAMHPKMGAASKLRSSDAQCPRLKSSPGVGGINKLVVSSDPSKSTTSTILKNDMDNGPHGDSMALLEQRNFTKGSKKPNVHEDELVDSPNNVVKRKVSRLSRTGSIIMLESSVKGSSHATAQCVGQRSFKNSRTRRVNMVAPVSRNVEGQIAFPGAPVSDFSGRTSNGANGTLDTGSVDNNAPKVKRELDAAPSPFGFFESEESGPGENKTRKRESYSGEVALTASENSGAFLLHAKKNKVPNNEIVDGVQRRGRTGRRSSSVRPFTPSLREKLENVPTIKPLTSVKPEAERNKRNGRLPSKKLKDRKAVSNVGQILSGSSLDFAGASDDDREELIAAARSAHNASKLACSGPFWNKVESIFTNVSSEEISFLKRQLCIAEELDGCLCHMHGTGYNVPATVEHDELLNYTGERQGHESYKQLVKVSSISGGHNTGTLDKFTPLYQRVLSALIEDDDGEEFYTHDEGKSIYLHYASDDSYCGSCNLIDVESKDRDKMDSEVESELDFVTQRSHFLDRLSCDKSCTSNKIWKPSISNSTYSSELGSVDDDLSHSDIGHANEIRTNVMALLDTTESIVSGISAGHQYQQMSLDDRLALELQSIGLFPETLPDLAEGEIISQDILELEEGLFQQIGRKRKKLGKIDKGVQKGKEDEKRSIQRIAMDQLVEIAYRKRMACAANSTSKGAIRKVSKQAALAFVQRTLGRCKKFEDTGDSCFTEPKLQEILFSRPTCCMEAKSADCVGSGTASNTCNDIRDHHTEAGGSGTISSTFERQDCNGDNIGIVEKKEVLFDEVNGSASSRLTSALENSVRGGVKGKRSDRERDQNKAHRRTDCVSGVRDLAPSGARNDLDTKSVSKQKSGRVSTSQNGPRISSHPLASGSGKLDREVPSTCHGDGARDTSREADENIDLLNLSELDAIGFGDRQDIDILLNNIDEDFLADHDTFGLAIPTDDLSELNFM